MVPAVALQGPEGADVHRIVRRIARSESRPQAPAREQMRGGELLREPARVLEAQRDQCCAQLEALGALRERDEEQTGRGQGALQVPHPHIARLDAELLGGAEQLQARRHVLVLHLSDGAEAGCAATR